MSTLHTGRFARFLAALAILGLLLAGASTTVMAMPMADGQQAMQSQPLNDAGLSDMHKSHHGKACDQAAHADCDTSSDGQHCNAGGDCCPHGATGVPPQAVTQSEIFPAVLAATPQWRSSSVTPVTEIRPPISTL